MSDDPMMRADSAARRLVEAIDLFADVPGESLDRLAEAMEQCVFAPGEVVVREGEEGDDLFVVESGELVVTVDRGSQSAIVGKLGPSDVFGEMAILRGGRRTASVTAQGEVVAWRLSRGALQRVLDEAPALAERLQQQMRRRDVANALHGMQ